MALLATGLLASWSMHQRANAAPVDPTWQQPVITVDDRAMVEVAQQWGSSIPVRFVESGADVHVSRLGRDAMTGGEATKTVEGDRITGCRVELREGVDSPTVLAHEFGHCLGLHHDNEAAGGSVMYWIGNDAAPTVTDTDRAALAALYERNAR